MESNHVTDGSGKSAGSSRPAEAPLPASSASLRGRYAGWLVLSLGGLLTAAAAFHVKAVADQAAEQEFDSHAEKFQHIISNRLDDQARILMAGAALFKVSEDITRLKWRVFTESQRIQEQLPGTQGVGVIFLIPRSGLERHLQEIRGQGFPEYAVRPAGDREVYSSVVYLEPFSGRNLRAFGYDVLTEPVRREAAERARDLDGAALSGKMVLVQETDEQVQAGALMFVPVYRQGMPVSTVDQRRAAIRGWVYSAHRMDDLIQGLLDTYDLGQEHGLRLQLFDGNGMDPERLLYASHAIAGGPQDLAPARFSRRDEIVFNGHCWTVVVSQSGDGLLSAEYRPAWLVLLGGSLVSFLLFALIRALADIRIRAQRMAQEMTADLQRSEENVKQQAGLINSLLDSIPDIIFFKDIKGVYLGCNPLFAEFVGRTKEQIVGKTDYDLFDRELADFFRENDQKMLEQCEPRHNEEWISYPDGRRMLLDTLKTSYWGPDGRLLGILGISRDITERRQAEDALRKSEEQVTLLLHSTAEAIYGIDLEGKCTFANPSCLKMLGYSSLEQVLGRNMHALIHHSHADGQPLPVEECRIYKAFREELGEHVDDEVLWRADGSCFPAEYWSYPMSANGVVFGAVVTFIDITERRQAEETIRHLANHDELTDLPSMRLARERLALALAMARRHKTMVAVMFVDLDGFKAVNDSLGHAAGDVILKQVSRRLVSCVRETDTVARAGGDEFLVVATDVHAPENAAVIAEKILRCVEQPVVFDGREMTVGASIGIALYPEHGLTLEPLIKQADDAMYRVKKGGKAAFGFASPMEAGAPQD